MDCLDPNQMAAYLAGRCSEQEREEMETHFIDCAECRGGLAIAIRVKSETEFILRVGQRLKRSYRLLRESTQLIRQ